MWKIKIENMGQMQTKHNRFRLTKLSQSKAAFFLHSANERAGVGYEMYWGRGQQRCKTPLTRRDKETP